MRAKLRHFMFYWTATILTRESIQIEKAEFSTGFKSMSDILINKTNGCGIKNNLLKVPLWYSPHHFSVIPVNPGKRPHLQEGR